MSDARGSSPPAKHRTLWLLRHGQAGAPPGVDDAARPLTVVGEAQARAAGVALAERAPRLAVVLCSPRLRAHHTAQLAAEAHGAAPGPLVIDELGGDYGVGALLALLSPWDDGDAAGDLLVVGHNPTLAWIAHQLSGDDRGFSTGTLVGIDRAAGRLSHYVAPHR
ncbi:MAG: histidine phosphatase family protein [Patulibacter sp.]